MKESATRKASAGTDHPLPRTPTSTLPAAAIIKWQVLKPGSDTDNHSLSGVILASAVSVLLPFRKPGQASQCQPGKSTFIKSRKQGRGDPPPSQKQGTRHTARHWSKNRNEGRAQKAQFRNRPHCIRSVETRPSREEGYLAVCPTNCLSVFLGKMQPHCTTPKQDGKQNESLIKMRL